MGWFVLGIIFVVGGVIALVVARVARPALAPMEIEVGKRRVRRPAIPLRPIGIAGIGFGLLFLVLSTVRLVQATDVGIPVTLGKIGSPLSPGIHLTAPWTEVATFSTRLQVSDMNQNADEGDRTRDDSVTVLAREGGALSIDVTVKYVVESAQASALYRNVRSMDGVREVIVRPDTRSLMRNVYSRYTAEEGYTLRREEIEGVVNTELKALLAPRGVIIDSVAIRDIRPTQQIVDAINQKLAAQQAAERAKIEQQKAQTEAETRRKVAETDAAARVIAAEGEAKANDTLAKSLTPEILKSREIEAIAKNQNTVLYPYGSTTTPIVDARGATGSAPPTTAGG